MEAFVNTFVFNQMNVNSYILWNNEGDCVFIDPGCITAIEQRNLIDFIDKYNLKPSAILVTHGHFDHIAGISFLNEKYECKCWIHPEDEQELIQAIQIAQIYGVKIKPEFKPDYYFHETKMLTFGKLQLKVLHLPGHTRGSVALFETQNNYLLAGDTIMKGSLGFSNSGYDELLIHLKHKIYSLPDETTVFCGHGSSTTIKEEKKSNLFFRLMEK